MKASRPLRATQLAQLRDPDNAVYLEEALAAGDVAAFKPALRNVAEARLGGMSALAARAQLNREALYRSLSASGNPTLDTDQGHACPRPAHLRLCGAHGDPPARRPA